MSSKPPDSKPKEVEAMPADLSDQFSKFDPDYVKNVIGPNVLVRTYQGERPLLPMIDVKLSKENAMPDDLWGLICETWKPDAKNGVILFLQGLENRGPNNRRKRIYMSAMTPDLYRPMYQDKVVQFFTKLLDVANAGKPLMRSYLAGYFDLYWDLHLGLRGDTIPTRVLQFGESLNTVLAYRDPTQKIVYENYMFVHANLAYLRGWIAEKLADLNNRKIANPERTFAYYWVRNAEDGENFQVEDIISECIHDFFAYSQWGTTIYDIMLKLSMSSGDPATKAWFKKTMESNFDETDGMPFTPLERFVMELLRVITPNSGSLSRIGEIGTSRHERPAYLLSPHAVTNLNRIHWKDHDKFNPDRYNTVPTSDQIDEAACEQMGFVRCPFERTTFDVRDGRRVVLHNSGFGTVYGVVDGKPVPVCDHAGFAPFGFGYRRCPGEQFTIKVFEDFLRKVWTDKIQFLNIVNPVQVPVGPATVTDDNIAFTKTT
jgi:hypothetical protein